MSNVISRRQALQSIAGVSAALATTSLLSTRIEAAEAMLPEKLKGRIHHSACKWCYKDIPLETLCQNAERIGLAAIDLLDIADFPTLKKYGVACGMVWGVPGGITKGLNRVEHHDAIVAYFEDAIPKTAAAGFTNIICFSGNRGGMSNDEGIHNCTIGLKRITPLAEKHGINICMELLNSKVDHHDYMCDRTPWGVELCKSVGSERFKLLYDIYHMQIMEGDMIRTIRDNHQYIAHYHTGGVPGRHEIDNSQEIYYPAVMEAIVATGFKGFVAQEFIPTKTDKLASLSAAVRICDV
ncbi:MAG TPA: TIM barrel protein [Opitutaceae bacterium]|nr:TIM barrel protein [Opitutaceae bacterium]